MFLKFLQELLPAVSLMKCEFEWIENPILTNEIIVTTEFREWLGHLQICKNLGQIHFIFSTYFSASFWTVEYIFWAISQLILLWNWESEKRTEIQFCFEVNQDKLKKRWKLQSLG